MRLMPKMWLLALLAPCLAAPAHAIPYDPFSYALGDLNGRAGGTGWAGPWTATTANESIVQPAVPLRYTIPGGVLLDGGGRALQIAGNSDTLATRTLLGPQQGDVYVGLLLRWEQGTVGQNDFLAIWFDNVNGPQLGVKGNRDTSNPAAEDFFIRMGGSSATTAYFGNIADNETTFLLVAHIYKNASSTYNAMQLWVNPTAGDYATPDVSVSGSLSLTQLGSIGIRGANIDGDDRIWIDELRIGATWRDVVPLPEPGSLLLLGAGLLALARRSARRRRA